MVYLNNLSSNFRDTTADVEINNLISSISFGIFYFLIIFFISFFDGLSGAVAVRIFGYFSVCHTGIFRFLFFCMFFSSHGLTHTGCFFSGSSVLI